MLKILVTGSEGQLGNEVRKLSGKYNEFSFEYTDVDNLDITNLSAIEELFSKNEFNYILNCAAYTNVDKSETDRDKAFQVNVLAVRNLIHVSKKYNCKIIHISTDYVFDSSLQNFPFKEDDPTNTTSAYGSTKLLGEMEFDNSVDYIIIRTSWLYSTFGNNIVKTILRLAKERDELNFVFDQVGTPTYAADLAATILYIIDYSEKSHSFEKGIYHYSNEGVCSWYDFTLAVVKISGLKCKVNPIETKQYPLPAKRPSYSVLNKAKIKEVYKIKISHWTESLEKCMKELLSL